MSPKSSCISSINFRFMGILVLKWRFCVLGELEVQESKEYYPPVESIRTIALDMGFYRFPLLKFLDC